MADTKQMIKETLDWLNGKPAKFQVRLSQNAPYAFEHVNPDHLEKIKIKRDPDESEDDWRHTRNVYHNGKDIGTTSHALHGIPSSENRTASRIFPDANINKKTPVYRIHGIYLNDDWHGTRLGRHMYLDMFNQGKPDGWFYNSQSEPPATAALEKLKKDGLIDLHWEKHPLSGKDDLGGTHLARITEKGRNILANKTLLDNKSMNKKIGK